MAKPDLIREAFLSELENSSKDTKTVRLIWVDRWLSFVEGKPLSEWDKSLVQKFRNRLKSEKYSPLSVRLALSIVKRCFDAAKTVHEKEKNRLIQSANPNDPASMTTLIQAMSLPGPKWDVGKRWMPEVQSSDIAKPEISIDDLAQIIKCARSGKLTPAETAFTAVASIYGYRRGELCNIQAKDINYKGGLVYRETEKGGERRDQILAPCIVPYLIKYPFDLKYSPTQMSKLFHIICAKSGVKTVYHQGWHSFRHRVLVDIRDTFAGMKNIPMEPALIAKIFLCWKQSTSSQMEDRYYTKKLLEIDKLVIDNHPIAKYWK